VRKFSHKYPTIKWKFWTSTPIKDGIPTTERDFCLPPPTVKKKGFTTRTQPTDAGSAKPNKDIPHRETTCKKSAGNRVVANQENPSSVIYKCVPSQSSSADVTLMEIEPSTPPTPITWRKKPHRSLQDPSMCPATRIDAITDELNRKWLESIATPLGNNTYFVPRMSRSLYTADPLATVAITRPTGNQSTLKGVPNSKVPPTNST
jgi:hypothetical protein